MFQMFDSQWGTPCLNVDSCYETFIFFLNNPVDFLPNLNGEAESMDSEEPQKEVADTSEAEGLRLTTLLANEEEGFALEPVAVTRRPRNISYTLVILVRIFRPFTVFFLPGRTSPPSSPQRLRRG